MEEGNVLFNMDLNGESYDQFSPNKILLPIPQMNVKIDLR